MSGSPAIDMSVGIQSLWLISSLVTVPGLMTPGQRTEHGHAECAFPVGVLLRAEGRHRTVGPGVHVRPVVARVDDEGVVCDPHVVQRLEDRADRCVVLDHAVDVLAVAVQVPAAVLARTWVRRCMRVELNQTKKGLPAVFCRFMKSIAAAAVSSSIVSMRFLVSGAGILYGLLADLAEARIDGGVVHVGRLAS